ncbi:MAG: OpgC domain-containing protein [Rhodospirillaceae bacterium]|nr:OpgC domain-containing protein [Rhodospirillaceae bacterium]
MPRPVLQRSPVVPSAPPAAARDLRLDFFRGLALIFIFVDHVPGNVFGHFTLRNFGFVDAAEVFVFIAGYAATLAYGKAFARRGFTAGSRRVGKRLWQIYLAHVVLLLVCVGGIGVAARLLENPVYYEFINLVPFAYEPVEAILRALALNHHLVYLNILPLYIALLAWFPVFYWLLQRHAALAIGASLALYAAANLVGIDLPSYPNDDGWFFNPFAWQLLFSLGALAAHYFGTGRAILPRSRWLVALAAAYALFALVVIAPWVKLPGLETWRLVPGDLLAPMEKSTLSPWRLAHILALAYLVAVFVKPDGAWYRRGWARGIIQCGRNSLDIFALGTILSFFSLFVLVEAGRDLAIQAALNLGGVLLMILVARWLSRKKAQATPNTIPALAPAVASAVSPAAPRSPAS